MPTFAVQSHRGVEQLVARRAHNPEAGGSSPSPATKFNGHREIDVRFLFSLFDIQKRKGCLFFLIYRGGTLGSGVLWASLKKAKDTGNR